MKSKPGSDGGDVNALQAVDPVEKRRIQAELASVLYEKLAREMGEAKATELFRHAITKASIKEGAVYAESSSGDLSPARYLELMQSWSEDGTLVVEPIDVSTEQANFHVTRCKYAEMYQAENLTNLGSILSCGRDAAICSGFNPDFQFERSQTIMEGGKYCDFLINWKS